MKTIIIIGLIVTNFASIAFVGKYKSISEKSIQMAKESFGLSLKTVQIADAFEQKFHHCVKINSKKRRKK